jgi:hypothetical protein
MAESPSRVRIARVGSAIKDTLFTSGQSVGEIVRNSGSNIDAGLSIRVNGIEVTDSYRPSNNETIILIPKIKGGIQY